MRRQLFAPESEGKKRSPLGIKTDFQEKLVESERF